MTNLFRAKWISGFGIRFDRYVVIKETVKSYKLRKITIFGLGEERWMRKNAKRRFARESKSMALQDLLVRLTLQRNILQSRYESAVEGIERVKQMINDRGEDDKRIDA